MKPNQIKTEPRSKNDNHPPFLVGGLIVAIVTATSWCRDWGRFQIYDVQNHVHLGVERPDVAIDVVELDNTVFSNLFGRTIPSRTAVRVTGPRKAFWLENLNDLKGYVSIRTPADALTYVRLVTSSEMIYAGASDASEVTTQPEIGTAVNGPGAPRYTAGLFGMLSAGDYKADGFTPTTVYQSNTSFLIRRWVCTLRDNKRIQLWDETVDADGGYSRKIVNDLPAPTSRGEAWSIAPLK